MNDIARRVANILLDINAVSFATDRAFNFTGGILSPIYVDCRRVLSYPSERKEVVDFLCKRFRTLMSRVKVDVIAGGETAGIPFAALVADKLDLPLVYVRKTAKEFGHKNRIEGALRTGQSVVLVEDLVSDAGSKVSFCSAIRDAGAEANQAVVIFDYSIAEARTNLAENWITLCSLTDGEVLLETAQEQRRISPEQVATIKKFLSSPRGWNK
ncbi:MAG: orotate phosphoribosyltransferase [Gammaproteobacteria bacterium]